MGVIAKVFYEAVLQAFQQLRANKLRSFLSLLGVSIGIFCIIGVLSAVDSLEDNVRGSLAKLGSDIIYVKKWPWADVSGEWWKYIKRPNPDYRDYQVVNDRAKLARLTSFHVVTDAKTLKFNSNSVEGAVLVGASLEFPEMFAIEFEKGRYFSPSEYNYGSNKAVLGYNVAEELFGSVDPVDRTVKLQGKDYEVIGVIKKSGNDLLDPMNFDDVIMVAYTNARGLVNLKSRQFFDTTVAIKVANGVNLRDAKDEARGIMRAHRRLKPREEDNFSLNELSMISRIFDNFFGVLNLLGIVIGLFAMLVGMVSVANIMFVSVKERTSIIGVKKALGAKQYIILMEFLIEAIILCVIGGAIGLLLVAAITKVLSGAIDFALYIDLGNVIIGVLVSVAVGVIAGFIPALKASKMDPVEAMRAQ